MSNPAITWVREHPALAGTLTVGVAVLFYVISRAKSSGAVASTSNSQNAALTTQNAAIQANLEAQQTTAQLSAQVENNKTAGAIAQSIAQFNAQQNIAKLAADVENNKTNQQADVSTHAIDAQVHMTDAQIRAESQALQSNYDYLKTVNNNTATLTQTALSKIVKGGSTLDYNTQINAALALATGQPGAVGPLVSGAANIDYGYNAADASKTGSIASGASNVAKSLLTAFFS